MPRSKRSKKNPPIEKPPIEISDEDSTSTFSPPSPSPGPFRKGEKRGHPQSSTEKENQKPAKKTIKPTTTTDSTAGMPFYTPSIEEHLGFALGNLTQACKGLEEEEEEEREELKEQVKQLVYYTQSILSGENPFIQEEEEEEEEVGALRKEVASTKETYAERLKKGLPTSSSLPSPPLLSPTPSPSSRSTTSTRSRKKQLQERKLVLITAKKDQPLDTFSIRNK